DRRRCRIDPENLRASGNIKSDPEIGSNPSRAASPWLGPGSPESFMTWRMKTSNSGHSGIKPGESDASEQAAACRCLNDPASSIEAAARVHERRTLDKRHGLGEDRRELQGRSLGDEAGAVQHLSRFKLVH